jgi:hypothetical protein
MTRVTTWVFLIGAAVVWLGGQAGAVPAEEVLPKPPAPFKGKIDISRDQSTPDWPQKVSAPAGAPNILLVLLDDVGFGATSALGGPVETPELEKLAAAGLRTAPQPSANGITRRSGKSAPSVLSTAGPPAWASSTFTALSMVRPVNGNRSSTGTRWRRRRRRRPSAPTT